LLAKTSIRVQNTAMTTPKIAYQWLLFDADGTLFDYDRAEAKALEGTFRDFNLTFEPEHAGAYQKINHQIWLDFENGLISAEALRVVRFERLFATIQISAGAAANAGANAQTFAGEFSRRYLHNLAMASDLVDGAEEIVRALHRRYHLALITNGLKDVQRPRLAHSAIADCFEAIAISEELGVAKPDPRYFDAVFSRIGQPAPESVLVIGDSLTSDIQGGINYGLDTCWFNPGGKPANPKVTATYQIQKLEELKKLLL
jgi:YjjG family noncanonical pyrimidine nucleotidase